MFAHRVIDDIPECSSRIRNSQKFHLGEVSTLLGSVDISKRGEFLFRDEIGDVNLPYPLCWFDFFSDKPPRVKCGMIASSGNDGIGMEYFCTDSGGTWHRFPMALGIAIPGGLISSYWIPDTREKLTSKKEDIIMEYMNSAARVLNVALLLLNCKNIGTEKVLPPGALNKKRIKRCKQPLFTYRVLVVKPVGKKQESIPKHIWDNRVHLARGHFKTYTEESPLFGRIIGRYWWQPCVRGRNHKGVVMKDYVVEPAKER